MQEQPSEGVQIMATEVGRVGKRRERDLEELEVKTTRAGKARRASASREAPVHRARERVQEHKVGKLAGRGNKTG